MLLFFQFKYVRHKDEISHSFDQSFIEVDQIFTMTEKVGIYIKPRLAAELLTTYVSCSSSKDTLKYLKIWSTYYFIYVFYCLNLLGCVATPTAIWVVVNLLMMCLDLNFSHIYNDVCAPESETKLYSTSAKTAKKSSVLEIFIRNFNRILDHELAL